MLKIKKDIPLWELEKYGFIFYEDEVEKKYVHPTGLSIMVETKNSIMLAFGWPVYEDRQVYIPFADKNSDVEGLWFDLIEDGLIEKKYKFRIKDEIGNDELEKYGFEFCGFGIETTYSHEAGLEITMTRRNQELCIRGGLTYRTEREIYFAMEGNERGYDRLLYELIIAGFVERLGDRYGRRYNIHRKLNKQSFKRDKESNSYTAILEGFYIKTNSIEEEIIEYANELIQKYENNIEKITNMILENKVAKEGMKLRKDKLLKMEEPIITIKNKDSCEIMIELYTEKYISLECLGIYKELLNLSIEGLLNKNDYTYIQEATVYSSMNDDFIAVELVELRDDMIDYVNFLLLGYKANEGKIMKYILSEKAFVEQYTNTITKSKLREALDKPTIRVKDNNRCTMLYDIGSVLEEKMIKIECEGVYEKIISLSIGNDY